MYASYVKCITKVTFLKYNTVTDI